MPPNPRCLCGTCRLCYKRKLKQASRRRKAAGLPPVEQYARSPHAVKLHHEYGLPIHSIWRVSGVARRETVERAVAGMRVYSFNADALDAVDPHEVLFSPDLEPNGYVPARSVQRRLRALNRAGWPNWFVAEHLGVSSDAVQKYHEATQCERRVLIAVNEVYRKYAHKPGPSNRVRLRAERQGWPSVAAWDDIDFDTEPVGMETACR